MAWKKLKVVNKVLEKGVHYQTQAFKKGTHNGIDMIGKGYATDWEVAIHDGKVVEVAYSSSRGYYVGVKMPNNYIVRYLHMKEGSIQVKTGEKVKKGQRLGYMGNSGYYNGKRVGTHLHLAVVNTNGNFVDPLPYLQDTKSFDKNEWVNGDYKLLYEKYLRESPEVKATNKARYKNLSAAAQAKCTKDKLGYAKYKVGAKINIKEFKADSKANLWGRTNTLWVCVKDSTGKQVEKV